MSSINYIYNSTLVSNYKGDELSIYTKNRLEALGIEPSSVSTEAQAQIIIAQAEAASSRNNSEQKQGGNSSREQLVSEAKQLALKVGVQVSEKDSLEDILDKISDTLNVMASNPLIADKVKDYQDELKDIAQRADIIVDVQKNIFNTMEMISVSNKLILGL